MSGLDLKLRTYRVIATSSHMILSYKFIRDCMYVCVCVCMCEQMLRLMDRELKMSGLDLKLTPYRVIATSATTGMVERVEGNPLSRVLRFSHVYMSILPLLVIVIKVNLLGFNI